MNKYSISEPRLNLPAGTYYVGDPCYVIKDEEWMQALDETNYFNVFASPEAVLKAEYNPKHLMNGVFLYHVEGDDPPFHLAASITKYGDGEYPCKESGSEIGTCGVDAGLIAVIPVAMIEKYGQESGLALGVIHQFNTSFGIRYSDGTISFGDVSVYTNDDEC